MLFDLGTTPFSNRVYKSVQNKYGQFCAMFSFPYLSLSEPVLCIFLSFEGVKHQSVKCYLAALHHMQIVMKGGDLLGQGHFPHLEYVRKGLKQNGLQAATNRHLPITPDIVLHLHGFWNH